ncbi:MAG TPA: UDP-N-acetylmuramoyl-L-alanyl-D-glutamate--2,6-diaminopimelate ligase [Burkholderiales bacterium]|nr:UDP-N-acetylmuramoyl-L-alanyl-D-glutamate--2,6-diaminopimelate ligase [Burkholderiales bacterium]
MELTERDLFARLAAQGAMIERLSSNSRRCTPGTAFFAYPGEAADGRAYIPDALARGASAVFWEEAGFGWQAPWQAPNVGVRGLRQRAGALAHEFHGRPSEALWVCGVTGTNGKTSCSQWIAAALGALGCRTGVIGTLGSGFPGALAGAVNTTPDALETHAVLKGMLEQCAGAVAMEVSSHGLAQGRVNAVRFACALFTNLSHDHLDYHGSFEAYEAAKGRLFDTPGLRSAVLNVDDAAGARLAQRLAGRDVRVIGYSLSKAATAEYLLAAAAQGQRVRIESSWGTVEAAVKPLGRFNVSNALGVLGCLLAFGVPFPEAVARLAELPDVPGRMQRIGDEPLVVVDYAHTPDALENVLAALRPVADARGGRLVAVFGAGGDRDAAKRPLMGAAASRLADWVVLTSDNPRGEDPLAIIAAIRRGAGACEVEPDRRRAIEQAVSRAGSRDVILVAGKGHESSQEIQGRREPFSDEAEARAALARRGAR